MALSYHLITLNVKMLSLICNRSANFPFFLFDLMNRMQFSSDGFLLSTRQSFDVIKSMCFAVYKWKLLAMLFS